MAATTSANPGLSSEWLSLRALVGIVEAQRSRSLPFGRPAWRGRMHTWAFVVALPAGAMLTSSAQDLSGRVSAAVYTATLILVFGTSAAYHRITRTDRSRMIMRKLDHSMIYLLIAGTSAPLCLVAMPRTLGVPLLAIQVAMAVVGIVLTNVAFDRAHGVKYALYPLMVVVAIAGGPTMLRTTSATQVALLAAGVVAYATGLPVLMRKRPDPWPSHFGYHEIWHALTIVAAALHFAAIHDIVT